MRDQGINIIGFYLPDEPYGCFSNWFMLPFEYVGIEYCCMEQALFICVYGQGG